MTNTQPRKIIGWKPKWQKHLAPSAPIAPSAPKPVDDAYEKQKGRWLEEKQEMQKRPYPHHGESPSPKDC